MNTKLTLTLEKKVIEKAKKYASSQGRSLSELVENYFKFLTDPEKETQNQLLPKTKALKGIVKVDKNFDYNKVLEEEINKKSALPIFS